MRAIIIGREGGVCYGVNGFTLNGIGLYFPDHLVYESEQTYPFVVINVCHTYYRGYPLLRPVQTKSKSECTSNEVQMVYVPKVPPMRYT